MAMYVVAYVKVTDESWVESYTADVHHIVHKHGGEYLARSSNIVAAEGDPPDADVLVLLKFPSAEALEAFATDPEYAPYGEARRAGSVSTFHVIDDIDSAGQIDYLTGD